LGSTNQQEQILRTFVAVPLPPEIKQAAAGVMDEIKFREADVKWVPAENFHLTLKFLGETPSSQIESICGAIQSAITEMKPFQVTFHGVGAFPKIDRPQVIWIGIQEGHEPLKALAGRIESQLDIIGFPREKRPFSVHLTLGRLRSSKGIGQLAAKIRSVQDREIGSFQVDRVVLMRSDLRPAGPIYTPFKEFFLSE
jgi:2'-5' RNA ligase